MSKSAKKRPPASNASAVAKDSILPDTNRPSKAKPAQPSKQSRVIAMLKSPKGATIEAMKKATGWQQHSVRGFLAGVVRKRLKLKLSSQIVGDHRVYRVSGNAAESKDHKRA